MFLKLLARIKGIVAEIGYPAANDRPAMFLTPFWNFVTREAGSMFKTA
jgi:hypothetical protein